MDMDFINKLKDIRSFVELEKIYESWIEGEVINDKVNELQMGYLSLITYPSIYLTDENAATEIEAVNACHNILLTYAKDSLNQKMKSDDDAVKFTATCMLMPPEKYILSICKHPANILYFLKGLYGKYSDEQLASVNGDNYAKVWINVLSKTINPKPGEECYEEFQYCLKETLSIISKMQLSQQYEGDSLLDKIRLASEKNSSQINNVKNNSGCLGVLLVGFTTALLIACSII